MGFRFRKQIRIAPGLKVNLSKSGASFSLGGRGASLNLGRRGQSVTTGLPGTGLSYRQRIGRRRPAPRHGVLALAIVAVLAWVLFHAH